MCANPKRHQQRLQDRSGTCLIFKRIVSTKAKKRSIDDLANQVQEREGWMTQLPELARKDFGLGARQFRHKAVTVDKDLSAWTDTPADREKKQKLAAEGENTTTACVTHHECECSAY